MTNIENALRGLEKITRKVRFNLANTEHSEMEAAVFCAIQVGASVEDIAEAILRGKNEREDA